MILIIPAYNEEKTIGQVIREAKKHLPLNVEIVVVNDGSNDQTETEAIKAGAYVINHPVNLGYGQALATGYIHGIFNNHGLFLQMDGDGQHHSKYLSSMLRELTSGADVVIGSRFLGDSGYRIPFLRWLGMKIFSTITSRKTGLKLTDTTSGFRAMNQMAVRLCLGPSYDADALVKMNKAGLKIKEIPVKMKASRGKSMHGSIASIIYVFKMLYALGRD